MFAVPTSLTTTRALVVGGVTVPAGTVLNTTEIAAFGTKLNVYLSNGAITVSPDPHGRKAIKTGSSTPVSFPPVVYNAVVAGVESAATVPDAPTAPVAVGGVLEALLSWAAPANDGGPSITGYTVQYDTVPTSGGWTSEGATGSTDPEYTITLAAGDYVFRVAAVNSEGVSAYSASSATFTVTAE